jgi:hypothetical protein
MLLSNWGLKWPPRGADLAWKIPITTSVRERIRFTVAWITSLRTLGPFNYNGWVGALTTEGHDYFAKHHFVKFIIKHNKVCSVI